MKREHEMPFGAQGLEDGRVRFRLWAPKAKSVDVQLAGGKSFPLAKQEQGWFELTTANAKAGNRYKFRIDGGQEVPDPASRFQPEDVHGPSEIINPKDFEWSINDANWRGRLWDEAVVYELHVGTFSPEGTYAGVEQKLDYLSDLGITAIELMPLSDFSGKRNWGYDGVLPYAPDSSYGRPEDLKRLIQSAHSKGLMVFLDVVYNHFGPDGNYIRVYAPDFFTDRHCTPWGEGINFDGAESRAVRDYFIHNALYWLEEYHFDGLRFDAVHAIEDDSNPDIITELAQEIRRKFGDKLHIHLVLENEDNAARYLGCSSREAKLYNAQWDDDIHHVLHVLTTGETDGYYSDYAKNPIQQLGRCLAEGFAFQNDLSEFRHGEKRGEVSKHLPPTAFVTFLQNHDQIGNRAFGDRIVEDAEESAIKAAMSVLLLAPSPPLLFMGEEFGARTPFLFFCDFTGDLAKAVTKGRRSEFKRFAKFADPALRAKIPDPNAESTFLKSKLDWQSLQNKERQSWLNFYKELLSLRQRTIVPLLPHFIAGESQFRIFEQSGLHVQWKLDDGRKLCLVTNFGKSAIYMETLTPDQTIYSYSSSAQNRGTTQNTLQQWSVIWYLGK
jgi:maltooligosyltrehalose trehalohydrolase